MEVLAKGEETDLFIIRLEDGVTRLATLLRRVATYWMLLADFNVAICRVEMLRSFGPGFQSFSLGYSFKKSRLLLTFFVFVESS